MFIAFAYVLAIVFSNIAFSWLPILQTPLGPVPTMAFFVGSVFVIRDYVQQRIGSRVLWTMLAGCVVSGVLAPPNIVVASIVAFAVSELTDFLVFTYTKKPFKDRILLSSVVSVPVDTALFLWLIGIVNPGSIIAMSLSKLLAAVAVWAYYKRKAK